MRRLLWLCAWAALLGPLASAQTPSPSSGLAAGIGQVDEGDFEGAITTLDGVLRDLTGQTGRSEELAQAHLHLGIAYVFLDQEKAGRGHLREALKLDEGLSLAADKFPPKVIRAFEEARRMAEAAMPTPTPTPTPPPATLATPRGGPARVWLYRPHKELLGRGADPPIFVDGRQILKMDRARYALVELEPGTHTFSDSRRAWIRMDLVAGSSYFLHYKFGLAPKFTIVSRSLAEHDILRMKPINPQDINDTVRVVAGATYPR